MHVVELGIDITTCTDYKGFVQVFLQASARGKCSAFPSLYECTATGVTGADILPERLSTFYPTPPWSPQQSKYSINGQPSSTPTSSRNFFTRLLCISCRACGVICDSRWASPRINGSSAAALLHAACISTEREKPIAYAEHGSLQRKLNLNHLPSSRNRISTCWGLSVFLLQVGIHDGAMVGKFLRGAGKTTSKNPTMIIAKTMLCNYIHKSIIYLVVYITPL